jgi:hypothetical protein
MHIEVYVVVEFTSPSGVGPVVPEGADSLNWSVPEASPPRHLDEWGFRTTATRDRRLQVGASRKSEVEVVVLPT